MPRCHLALRLLCVGHALTPRPSLPGYPCAEWLPTSRSSHTASTASEPSLETTQVFPLRRPRPHFVDASSYESPKTRQESARESDSSHPESFQAKPLSTRARRIKPVNARTSAVTRIKLLSKLLVEFRAERVAIRRGANFKSILVRLPTEFHRTPGFVRKRWAIIRSTSLAIWRLFRNCLVKKRARRPKRATCSRILTYFKFTREPSKSQKRSGTIILAPNTTTSHSRYSLYWKLQYARINERYVTTLYDRPSSLACHDLPLVPPQTCEQVELVLERFKAGIKSSPTSLPTPGFKYHQQNKLDDWLCAATWLLAHQPEDMMNFLKATHVAPYPATTYIQDSLQHLVLHFSYHGDFANLQRVADALPLLASRDENDTLFFETGDFVRLLTRHCESGAIKELWHIFKTAGIQVGQRLNYAEIACHFAKNDCFEQGFEALVLMAKLHEGKWCSYLEDVYTYLMGATSRQPDELRASLRMIDTFVGMGVLGLRTHHCNAVMHNAVLAGDMKTAFDVYNSLVEHDGKPTAHTYSILLKGWRLCLDDGQTLGAMIRAAVEHVIDRQLAGEILHCLALHYKKDQPNEAFHIVANAFAQMYDVAPLQGLIELPPSTQPMNSDNTKLKPLKWPIGILLRTYIDYLYQKTDSHNAVYALYKRFLALGKSGLEPYATMIGTDYQFNRFIWSFGRSKEGLLFATQVIKDMQEAPSDSFPHCAPTIITWNTYMRCFVRQREPERADRILDYIRSKGFEPDQISWNTVVSGYAGQQDVNRTWDSLKRFQEDGMVWNDRTTLAVSRLRNRDKLRAMFDKDEQNRISTPRADKEYTQFSAPDHADALAYLAETIELDGPTYETHEIERSVGSGNFPFRINSIPRNLRNETKMRIDWGSADPAADLAEGHNPLSANSIPQKGEANTGPNWDTTNSAAELAKGYNQFYANLISQKGEAKISIDRDTVDPAAELAKGYNTFYANSIPHKSEAKTSTDRGTADSPADLAEDRDSEAPTHQPRTNGSEWKPTIRRVNTGK